MILIQDLSNFLREKNIFFILKKGEQFFRGKKKKVTEINTSIKPYFAQTIILNSQKYRENILQYLIDYQEEASL